MRASLLGDAHLQASLPGSSARSPPQRRPPPARQRRPAGRPRAHPAPPLSHLPACVRKTQVSSAAAGRARPLALLLCACREGPGTRQTRRQISPGNSESESAPALPAWASYFTAIMCQRLRGKARIRPETQSTVPGPDNPAVLRGTVVTRTVSYGSALTTILPLTLASKKPLLPRRNFGTYKYVRAILCQRWRDSQVCEHQGRPVSAAHFVQAPKFSAPIFSAAWRN